MPSESVSKQGVTLELPPEEQAFITSKEKIKNKNLTKFTFYYFIGINFLKVKLFYKKNL